MVKNLKTARDTMDKLLSQIEDGQLSTVAKSVSSSVKSALSSLDLGAKTSQILAYVPLVTALCPSELGTSSDRSCQNVGPGAGSNVCPASAEVPMDKPFAPKQFAFNPF